MIRTQIDSTVKGKIYNLDLFDFDGFINSMGKSVCHSTPKLAFLQTVQRLQFSHNL